MAHLVTGPERAKGLDRPGDRRPTWPSARPRVPALDQARPVRAAGSEPSSRATTAPVSAAPKSPPPLKGQTGPRPGY